MKTPNVVFDFQTIEVAFEYANSHDRSNQAYLDRHTGESLFFSMYGDSDEEPDDMDDTDRYVAIPDTRDYGLGSQLAVNFASEVAPDLRDEVARAFHRRGGFRRFKALLIRHGLLNAWYEYRSQRERSVILHWCAKNDIRYRMSAGEGEGEG